MTSALVPLVQLEKKLKEYRLSGIAQTLEMRIKQAQEEELSYGDFLGLLLEDETARRDDNRHLRLYRGAKLPYEKGLEDFDFSFQPSIRKAEILELATLRFMDKKANVIFLGLPGTGKTHLSVALALTAMGKGKTVLFTTEWDKVFIDKTLTTAVVDRLLHHCTLIEIKGESYRFKRRDKKN